MSVEDPVTARRIRAGVIRILARPGTPPGRALDPRQLHALRRDARLRRPPQLHREPLAEAPEEERVDDEPLSTTFHWIEIALVDEAGTPCANERYEAKLPDGSVRRGRLGSGGVLRIDRIAVAGSVELSFPDLHPDAWRPA